MFSLLFCATNCFLFSLPTNFLKQQTVFCLAFRSNILEMAFRWLKTWIASSSRLWLRLGLDHFPKRAIKMAVQHSMVVVVLFPCCWLALMKFFFCLMVPRWCNYINRKPLDIYGFITFAVFYSHRSIPICNCSSWRKRFAVLCSWRN